MALATWVFAAVSVVFPSASTTIAVSAATAAMVSLLTAIGRRRSTTASHVGAVMAATLALAAAAAAHVAIATPERAALASVAAHEGRAVTIDAVVVGKVERSGRGWSLDAIARHVTSGDSSHATSSPVSIRVDERPSRVDLGAQITVSGSASPAPAGARAVISVRAAGAVTVRAEASGVLGAASHLRHELQSSTAGLPQPAAGLIAGLSVGDTSGVSPQLDAAMKASSLSHLTAVSGANCALVVGIAYGLTAMCGARRPVRVIAGGLSLIGFVVLVSPEPSVVRAATMAAVAMWGLLLGRVGIGMSVLATAVVVVLIFDPWLAMSLGFALSTAATASLLVAAGPLADGLTRWMPAPIALAVSVPLAAQLACGPLLVLIEPSVPLYGVLANLVAAPAAPAGTVLGLLACVASGLPLVSDGLAGLAWLPAAWITETARLTASVPGNAVPWLDGLAGLATLAVLGIAVILSVAPGGGRGAVRVAATLVVAAGVGAVIALGPLSDAVERLRTPADWSVAVCDVGQGDAILLRSAGQIALIDTGPAPAPLRACLDRFGVERIQLLVLTHFDLDHRGGAPAVLGRTDTVLHGPIDDPVARGQIDAFLRHGARAQSVAAGDGGSLGDSSWRVLWPPPATVAYEGNDASIVMAFSGGGIPRIVLLGDLSAGPQASLAADLTERYTVVKVAHHGSADQFADLYRRMAPAVALVTVGENTYGHPRQEILDLLSAGGANVIRTDQTGAATLSVHGDAVQVWRERDVASRR
jgi:competence protein ComEC